MGQVQNRQDAMEKVGSCVRFHRGRQPYLYYYKVGKDEKMAEDDGQVHVS